MSGSRRNAINNNTRKVCPECGAREAVPILYGLPDEEGGRLIAKGEVESGGYCIEDDQPQWRCKTCGHTWGSTG